MRASGQRTIIAILILGAAALAAPASLSATRPQTPLLSLPRANVQPLTFAGLDGWSDDDHAAAFAAFMKSCGALLNATPAMRAARPLLGGLFAVCERAAALHTPDREQARIFFEENFTPARITPRGETEGFFTGYYETEVEGSRSQTGEFNTPIYAAPAAAVKSKLSRVFGNFSRAQIEDGALKGKNLEICWVKNPVDAFFAQIQGSTRVKLDDGKLLRLNYVASNGQPYTPVGRWLIDRGIYTKEEMSMDRIREWMEANPEEGKQLRRMNRSFVFFQETDLRADDECIGAQGVPLTPGRSLAVDKAIHVYGTPIWVDAELPIDSEKPETAFRRLMVAQDTGAAIIGPARADIYFGHGEEVPHIAGRIKQNGRFVMLVPNLVAVKATPDDVPLPKPRPVSAASPETTATVTPSQAAATLRVKK